MRLSSPASAAIRFTFDLICCKVVYSLDTSRYFFVFLFVKRTLHSLINIARFGKVLVEEKVAQSTGKNKLWNERVSGDRKFDFREGDTGSVCRVSGAQSA